jgi:ribosomal protein L11 methyltransferase
MWQLDVLTTNHEYPEIEQILETEEALSVSMLNAGEDIIIEHELHEKPAWSFVKIEAIFSSEEQALHAKNELSQANLGKEISFQEVTERNWMLFSLKDFQAIEIANHLWIYPHWLLPDTPKEPYLVIDPGFAFGTGQHSTTKMCLEWLATHDVKQKTIIDYGCGSGILGIAALKMGAKKVYGVDIDPQACEASQQNASLNQITPDLFDIHLSNENCPEKVDILIANIVMNPLLEFKTYFYEKLNANSYLILSGLLKEQCSIVIEAYRSHFSLLEHRTDLEWGCLVFQPKFN